MRSERQRLSKKTFLQPADAVFDGAGPQESPVDRNEWLPRHTETEHKMSHIRAHPIGTGTVTVGQSYAQSNQATNQKPLLNTLGTGWIRTETPALLWSCRPAHMERSIQIMLVYMREHYQSQGPTNASNLKTIIQRLESRVKHIAVCRNRDGIGKCHICFPNHLEFKML